MRRGSSPLGSPVPPLPRLAILSLVGVGLSLAGCFRDPDPIGLGSTGDLSVHAVLEAGADTAVVLVTRVVTRDGPLGAISSIGYEGVDGARIRLLTGSDTTWMDQDSTHACVTRSTGIGGATDGCYRGVLPTPVRPGGRYRLEVELLDGQQATGETVIPSPVVLQEPDGGTRVIVRCPNAVDCSAVRPGDQGDALATIPLAWERPEGVPGAEVTLVARTVYWGSLQLAGESCLLAPFNPRTATDSLRWEIYGVLCGADTPFGDARFDSIRADLVLVAWNEHYHRYREIAGSPGVRELDAGPGLTGAYGVFGAVAPTTRSIILVRDPPPAP